MKNEKGPFAGPVFDVFNDLRKRCFEVQGITEAAGAKAREIDEHDGQMVSFALDGAYRLLDELAAELEMVGRALEDVDGAEDALRNGKRGAAPVVTAA